MLITGASKGIGFAIAQAFVAEGANVSICGRDPQNLDRAINVLQKGAANIIGSLVDVTDSNALTNWIEKSAQNLGGIDVLVLNVSAMVTSNSEENWRYGFETDLLSTVNCINVCRTYLEQSVQGAIVFISSTAALESAIDVLPATEVGPYGVFKAGLLNYASLLSTTLAPFNIRVNSVSPGPIEFEDGVWDKIKKHNKTLYDSMLARCRIGRLGKPEDVANAVVFLASPAASFITGTNLVVDGGATRRVQF